MSRILAVALRMISFESSLRLSIPASMLATISLYEISDGAGANFGPFCRTSISVLVRDLDEMFTTNFDLSTLLELRYSMARLLRFLECLSLIFLRTERARVFRNWEKSLYVSGWRAEAKLFLVSLIEIFRFFMVVANRYSSSHTMITSSFHNALEDRMLTWSFET